MAVGGLLHVVPGGHPAQTLTVGSSEVTASSVRVQGPVPEQAPDQPMKVLPEDAAAVRVTTVPVAKEAAQLVPQEMPAGLLVRVPWPMPDREVYTLADDALRNAAHIAFAKVLW